MYKKLIILASFFICFSSTIFARHIIGGIITYSYISDGKYKFTMKIYRDCDGGGASFDGDSGDNTPPQAAVIGFFKESGGSYQSIGGTEVKLLSKKKIDPPVYPCLSSPPNACVEEGIYEFEWTIPNFDQSGAIYHVVYQRCCRNNTISNIVNAKDVGATYTVAITPAAIKAKSSSPVFNNFPPTIICSPIPFNFDHSAKDADGDSLVYKMCSPLEGGGPDLSNAGASDCDGVRPNPTCPPPFKNVNFSNGFSDLQPLGASSSLNLDIKSGKLYLIPQNVGQYVVGVCVEEYRNGILLSKTFRDFQFNVGACQSLVTAGISAADTLVFQKKYIVRSCGSSDVTFVNGSTQEKFINSYLWSFDINGQKVTASDKNPTIKFPGLGKYNGTLILNLNQKPCTDTANIEVGIFPGIDANFKYAYDTCIAAPIQFTNLSTSGAQINKYEWNFKDGNKSNLKDPLYEYKIPGNFKVNLKVTDVNLCSDTITKPILYYPVPALLVVNPDSGVGCTPYTVRLNNLSYPIDKTYNIEWDLGDGTKSSEISPVKTYNKIGTYSLNLKLTSPIGCKTQASFPSLIAVNQSPEAMFSFTPEKLNSLENTAQFTDKSTGASKWSWQFGQGEGGSATRNPTYSFKDTGIHLIRLIVTHPSGCRDTSYQRTDIEPIIKFFMPNAFTPNYDSTNDDFKGKGITDGISNFQMVIFNRWGERVFETKNYNEGWNGRKNNVGELAPEGVYVYSIVFTGPRNKIFTYKGFATLLR